MKKLKIALAANDTTYTYNLRKAILSRLLAEGHEVIVVAKKMLFQEELQSMGCRLVGIETNRHGMNPLSELSLFRSYWKALKEEKPDLVLSYNIKPNSYAGIVCQKLKIHYIPNITGLGTPLEKPGIFQRMFRFLYKSGVSGADCIMFQNADNKQYFCRYHMLKKNTRTRLIPGSGVDLNEHEVLPYPDDKNQVHFLFIARVMKEKGIDQYLNVAKRVHERHPNTVFDICGYCDDKKYLSLLEEADKQGYIQYHGEQKKLKDFFANAHCIVHPSYYPEGMSNVLLEASAHGRPIITTERAGCREIVDDGITGFLTPIKDEVIMEKSIEKFLAMSWEQKKEMGLAGRRKVEREFDRELVVDAYIEEIERCYSEE